MKSTARISAVIILSMIGDNKEGCRDLYVKAWAVVRERKVTMALWISSLCNQPLCSVASLPLSFSVTCMDPMIWERRRSLYGR